MRRCILIFSLLFSPSLLIGQTSSVIDIDFEPGSTEFDITPGADLSDIQNKDYFGPIGPGSGLPADITYSGLVGDFFFGAQDTNGTLVLPTDLVTLRATSSITGCSNIQFSGNFAEDTANDGNEDWDISSSVIVVATIDSSPAEIIFAIESESSTAGNRAPFVDTNFDGVGDGPAITDVFTTYTVPVTGTGDMLTLEIRIQDLDTGDEDIAIDNVVVTGDACSPLPVEMSDLEIKEDKNVTFLMWQTFSEQQNAGFEIESLSQGQFRKIGFVEGAGNTQETQDYHFELSNLKPGKNQFRIRQIDFDGAFEISNVVETFADIPHAVYLSGAYPNPFNPRARFDFVVAVDQDVRIEMLDLSGRIVKTLFEGSVSANDPIEVGIDASDLPSGLYYYKFLGSLGAQAIQSVVLMK